MMKIKTKTKTRAKLPAEIWANSNVDGIFIKTSEDTTAIVIDAKINLTLPTLKRGVVGESFFGKSTPAELLTDSEILADWKAAVTECGTLEGIDTSDDGNDLIYTISVPRYEAGDSNVD